MNYERQFLVGNTYLTKEGKSVTIIKETYTKGYGHCVQGDDGEDLYDNGVLVSRASERGWRYDRQGDSGRVTGSAHDFSDPRNLVVGSLQVKE